MLATWLTFQTLDPLLGPDLLCVTYLTWALPLAAWLAGQTLFGGLATPVRPGARALYSSA
jgi:hypothetical protein